MIDFDGYRPNVGIVICNKHGQVLWAKRFGQNSWQFPQGGINEGENIETAMYRELYEEVGLTKKDVRLIWASKYWLKYKLPKRLVRDEGNCNKPAKKPTTVPNNKQSAKNSIMMLALYLIAMADKVCVRLFYNLPTSAHNAQPVQPLFFQVFGFVLNLFCGFH